ncbi:UTP--GlnB (protein PII) uridylyltransferase GlnD [Nicoletella semolina]|uniref:Bifunctional uridylyltransferase/uridylyl-removing enzyme n=1 Tax=Nicoletella semolina TaxID=271160 RepID=A0A4R2N9L7_9PAST|nr:bifunctional uridylyltransferase/uridylyl-removing protein GlnD [Nicoletella semolina]MDH2923809.1 bifunctional uridylyltransferase/uridylyl-removing protein [Nicoletella semolina]TCP17648.1 UTP--GlnB (protein PII) uridylyltransferase GlnD [Nicoletella semolina]
MNSNNLKIELLHFNQHQKAQFSENEFAQTNIIQLLQQRSAFYDQWLAKLWQDYGLDKRIDLALIAVGGYGRQEMFPLSDLDILILSEQPLDETTQAQCTALFNLLWDCKLQLGTAIRTIDECISVGKSEISVATNMLEGRFLCGNASLWQQLLIRLNQDDFWAIGDFLQAKREEQQARYHRYNNTSYNLEPDLKHSPGGLRDLHLLCWIMLRHYGIHSLEDLYQKGILFPEEFDELKQAQNVLFRMRFGLHLQLKRYDNRLRFDRQLQLSQQLGYQTPNSQTQQNNQAVEAMMKTFYQATQSISQLCQLILSSFEQQGSSLEEQKKPLQKNHEKRPLDCHFFIQQQTIDCQHYSIFQQQPLCILDLFFYLTQYPATTASPLMLRHLRLSLQKLTTPLSHQPQARERFIRLFSQPNFVKKAIAPMHQLGVLSAYLPQWQSIKGLMQFDLFHLYTVDEHTIRVMLKLESFLDNNNAPKHPLCCRIFPTLPNKPLLYLAALFHDIAKGRGGDHAEEGAKDIQQFAELHGFTPHESDEMAWLVAQHLTMSITAQRRDIHDPSIIREFAKIVQNQTALMALTCLTVADICATNETLWNDWKRTLFRDLFQLTQHQLQLGEKQINYQKIAIAHRNEAQEQLKLILTPQQHQFSQQFWQQCPENYFMRHTPTQLVWHALSFSKKPRIPMVLISNQFARGATEIFVYCQDQPQLFTRIAHSLNQKKVSILDAQIMTGESSLVFDSFIVAEQNGKALNLQRCQQIQKALLSTINQSKDWRPLSKKMIKHHTFQHKTEIRFFANSMPNQTACEISTSDREGLLVQIGHIFNQLELNLLNAKISTTGERAEDFFVLTTKSCQALTLEQQLQLKQAIIAELTV